MHHTPGLALCTNTLCTCSTTAPLCRTPAHTLLCAPTLQSLGLGGGFWGESAHFGGKSAHLLGKSALEVLTEIT